MKTKICFFVNEKSNSARAGIFIKKSESQILEAFPQSEIWYISNLNDLDTKAEEAAKYFNLIVVCGGDGTVLSVAKFVFKEQKLLAIIPLGSGNDFAKSIQLLPKQSIQYYINIISERVTQAVDFPAAGNELFLNIVGIGLDGLTNQYAQQFKWIRGRLKYTIAGIKAFRYAQPFYASLKIDTTEINGDFWMIALANGKVEGGLFKISPYSSVSDGQVEIILFPNYSRLRLAIAFIKLSFGIKLGEKYCETIPAEWAEIALEKPSFIHIDGETKKGFQHCFLKVGNQKIKVVVPPIY